METLMMMNLKQAISNVLETMFFLPVQFIDAHVDPDDWFAKDQELICARLYFNGPVNGSCYLWVPVRMAQVITSNFLGFGKEEINREQQNDTVKEALNMIGGHMLSVVENAGDYRLGIPETLADESRPAAVLESLQRNLLFVETDDNRLVAGIVFD